MLDDEPSRQMWEVPPDGVGGPWFALLLVTSTVLTGAFIGLLFMVNSGLC